MKKLLNPIVISILVLLVWIVGAISYAYCDDAKHHAGSWFVDIIYSILLTPFIAVLVFNTCLFFYKSWLKMNKSGAIAINAVLLIWIAVTIILFLAIR